MDEATIQKGLEELWEKGLLKSGWEFKIHTLEYVTGLVARIPREFNRKSDFLSQTVPTVKGPDTIDQEPSRDWWSLLAIPEAEKSRAAALEKFSHEMELTPGWVCTCTCGTIP